MHSTLLHLSLFATLFSGMLTTVNAQDHEISLVRTVKEGDHYGVLATGTEERYLNIRSSGAAS